MDSLIGKKGKGKINGVNLLLFALAAGVAWFYFVRAPRKISFGTPSVRLHSLRGGKIILHIDLLVINESDIEADVTAFIGQLFYGADSIGIINLLEVAKIPGFGQAVVKMSCEIGLVGIASQLMSIIMSDPEPLKNWKTLVDWSQFRVRGTLKIEGLPIDIDEPLTTA